MTEFIISPTHGHSLAYNWFRDRIEIPNKIKNEFIMNFQSLIESISHEEVHRWLAKNISLEACAKLDNIDKNYDNTQYLITNGGRRK